MEEICKKIIAQQVGEFIRTEIEERNFCPGMKLPSDTEMAESFGVQKQTVQTAIDALEKEGLLKRISNKEIYVLGKKLKGTWNIWKGLHRQCRIEILFRHEKYCQDICERRETNMEVCLE